MLKRPVVRLLAVCAALVPALALATETRPVAETIVDKHLEARGGEARLRAVSTVQLSLVTLEGDKTASVTAVRSRPDRVRYEVQKDGVTTVKAFDGARGWYAEGSAAPVQLDAQKSAKMAEGAHFDDVLVDPARRGMRLAFKGVEDVRGAPAFKLELTRGKDVETRYIDQKSFLEVKRVSRWVHEGRAHEKTAYFSDYRRVDGLMVAHTTEWHTGEAQGVTTVRGVRYDVPVDEALFTMPVSHS